MEPENVREVSHGFCLDHQPVSVRNKFDHGVHGLSQRRSPPSLRLTKTRQQIELCETLVTAGRNFPRRQLACDKIAIFVALRLPETHALTHKNHSKSLEGLMKIPRRSSRA